MAQHSKIIKAPYVRTRTKPATSIAASTISSRQWNSAGGQASSTYICSGKMGVSTFVDTVTPGFSMLRNRGEIINNPMSSVVTEYISDSATGWEVRWNDGSNWTNWTWNGPWRRYMTAIPLPSTPTVSIENLTRLAQTAVWADVEKSELLTGELVRDGRETISMLASPFKLISDTALSALSSSRKASRQKLLAGFIREYRNNPRYRRAIDRAVRQLNALRPKKQEVRTVDRMINSGEMVANLVLLNNLGVRPFLMDVKAIFDTIPNKQAEERKTARSTKSSTSSRTSTRTESKSGWTWVSTDVQTDVITVKSGLMYEIPPQLNPRADFGLRAQDIPATIWECLPYSFLVDYAVNVGDYITGMSNFIASVNGGNGLRTLAYFTVTKVESTLISTVTGFTPPSPWNAVTRPLAETSTTKTTTVTRNPGGFAPSMAYIGTSYKRSDAQLQNVLSLFVVKAKSYKNLFKLF